MSKFQKGTDGYVQAKNVKTFTIITTLLQVALFLLFVIPSNNFLHKDYARAGAGWHVAAFVSFFVYTAVNVRIIAKVLDEEVKSGGWIKVVTVGWFLLNILLLAGFNFSI